MPLLTRQIISLGFASRLRIVGLVPTHRSCSYSSLSSSSNQVRSPASFQRHPASCQQFHRLLVVRPSFLHSKSGFGSAQHSSKREASSMVDAPVAPATAPTSGKQRQAPLSQPPPQHQQQPIAEQQVYAGNGTATGVPQTDNRQHLRGAAAIIPLAQQHGAIVSSPEHQLAPGLTVLDALPKNTSVNEKASASGALVLGFQSPVGLTSLVDLKLGQVKFTRLLACARCKLWWMTPEWRTSSLQLPPETQFLLLELKEGGPYALLLPLIEGDFRATLRACKPGKGREGELDIRIESGADNVTASSWDSILYMSAGYDPYELIDRGVAAAAALSGGARPRVDKVLPGSLDYFGWCTWDAFYSTVSARGLREGLDSLQAGGITPRFLIIDDGWQMTDVDPAYRKSPLTELAEDVEETMHLGTQGGKLMQSLEEEYYKESLETIAKAGNRLPSHTAGNVMPTLLGEGPQPRHLVHSGGKLQVGEGASGSTDSANGAKPTNSSSNLTNGPGSSTAAGQTRKSDGGGEVGSSNGRNGGSSGGSAPAVREVMTEDVTFLARITQRVAGWMTGIGTAAFLIFYQWVIEPAPPNSLRVRWFAAAAQGPLKAGMLAFFAAASDFTRRLTSVRANGKFSSPDAGPDEDWEGKEEHLDEVVAQLRERYGLLYVYCWHGLPAYWAGVMPDSTLHDSNEAKIYYAKPTPGVLEIEPSMAWNPAVLAGIGVAADPSKLYNAMHSYLASSGVDGVKVDCQAGVGLIGSAMQGGAALSAKFHTALEASVQANFKDNHAINCMCHSTENLYRMTDTAVARASDDFYPRDPASIYPHIAACTYNTLFMSPLVHPDWDMFHSKHVAARLHAMARAISGGAVYVSDKPGEHDLDLLRQLVLPDGSIFRARGVARPTRDSLFVDVLRDGKSLLKAWNVNSVTAVVGIFHLQGSSWDRIRRKFYEHDKAPGRCSIEVRPTDVEAFRLSPTASSSLLSSPPVYDSTDGLSSTASEAAGAAAAAAVSAAAGGPPAVSDSFAAFSHNSRRLSVLQPSQALKVALNTGEGELLTFSPIMHAGNISFAPVGLMYYMNGGAAVLSCTEQQGSGSSSGNGHRNVNGGGACSEAGVSFAMDIRGCGELVMYSSRSPSKVYVNGNSQLFSFEQATHQLVVDVPKSQDLRSSVQVTYSS